MRSVRNFRLNARLGMASTLTSLIYHIIFNTKARLNLIDDRLEMHLHPYMGGIVRANGGAPIEIGGNYDHVHLLIRLKAAVSIADMVRLVKAGSSKWVRENHPGEVPFTWQIGYGAFTVSESQLERARIYVRNQKEHHRDKPFEQELRQLLAKHCVVYDEKYLLD